MKDRTQYLLWQLAQECNGVAQRISKTAQDAQPSHTDKQRLTQECTDLIAVIQMCLEDGIIFDPNNKTAIAAKQAKVQMYLHYVGACETLE